jgi:hypothetical protein
MKKVLKILAVLIGLFGVGFILAFFFSPIALLIDLFAPVAPLDDTGVISEIQKEDFNRFEVNLFSTMVYKTQPDREYGEYILFDIDKNTLFFCGGKLISMEEFLRRAYGAEVRVVGLRTSVIATGFGEDSPVFYPKIIFLKEPIYEHRDKTGDLLRYSDSKMEFEYPSSWSLSKKYEGKVELRKAPTEPRVKAWAKDDDTLTVTCNKSITGMVAKQKERLIIGDFDAYLIEQQRDNIHNSGRSYLISQEDKSCLVDYRVSGNHDWYHLYEYAPMVIFTTIKMK